LIEVAGRNATAELVEQIVYRVANSESKRAAVAKLIRERALSQVLVFTNTKIGASRLARLLESDGMNAAAIHGDKSQQERLAALAAFKKGEVSVLVATDVAARGLDIVELPAVINYDLPFSPEDYGHRIGRTARAGASGVALSLITGDDDRLLADIEKLLKCKLTPQALDVGQVVHERERIARADRPVHARREESSRSRRSRETTAPPKSSGSFLRDDPLFHQPYVPAASRSAASATESVMAAHGANGSSSVSPSSIAESRRARKQQLPALLGGLKKS
jgi:superfamily II DNA/RNA helicase